MKRFIIVSIILALSPLWAEGFCREEPTVMNHVSTDPELADQSSFSFSFPGISGPAVQRLSGVQFISGLPVFSSKFLHSFAFTEGEIEQTRKDLIENRVFLSEYHILEFGSTDIIHPFQYFW